MPESWTFYSSTEVLPRALVGFCLVQATSPIFSKSFQWVFQNFILSTWDIPWTFKGNFCANTIAENCLTGRVWGLFVCLWKAVKIFLTIMKPTSSSSRIILLSLHVLCSPGIGQSCYWIVIDKNLYLTPTCYLVSPGKPFEAIDNGVFSAIVSVVPSSFSLWLSSQIVLETLLQSHLFTSENWWMPIAFVFCTNSQKVRKLFFLLPCFHFCRLSTICKFLNLHWILL